MQAPDPPENEVTTAGLGSRLVEVTQDGANRELLFDGWRLRRDVGELWKGGVRVRIQDQPVRILEELLARPGELVTRKHLIARLWPKGIVDFDASLNTAMRKLRAALGDDSHHPRYIETVPRKGYRFIGRLAAPPPPLTSERYAPDPGGSSNRGGPPDRGSEHTRRGNAFLRLGAYTIVLLLFLGAATLLFERTLQRAITLQTGASASVSAEPSARSRAPDARPIANHPEAFDLYLRAKTRHYEIMPSQPEIGRGDSPAPRRHVLDLLERALRLDPEFAHAYWLRAQLHLDFFIANLDVGEERLEALRADLAAARRFSQDPLLGTEISSLYAAFVDLDPEEGLRQIRAARRDSDPAVLQTEALILGSMGRYGESNQIFEHLLSLDPANQRVLRMRMSNLASERRAADVLRVIEWLRHISPPEVDFRSPAYAFTGQAVAGIAHGSRVAAAPATGFEDEWLLALSPDLYFLRHEHRYADLREILAETSAESIRYESFIGALPGLGRRPVAELRGWIALLLGDEEAAARHGAEVREFVTAQTPTPWNGWLLHMLEAQARLFSGDHEGAISAVRESLTSPTQLSNVHVQTFREYLAAMTLAWAGAHADAVALLEKVTTVPAGIGPARIVREPLFSVPLREDHRYQRLARRLEAEIQENQRVEMLPPDLPAATASRAENPAGLSAGHAVMTHD